MAKHHLAERIVKFLQEESREPRDSDELAKALGVGDEEVGDFHAACRSLMRTGRVALGAHKALILAEPPARVVGSFRGNPQGFGFVVPDVPNAHGDVFVPPKATGGALTGDTVVIRVKKRGKRQGKMLFEGSVVEIVRRGQSQFVGELRKQKSQWYVTPDGNTLHAPILIADVRAKRAKIGDQVIVEIIQYPEPGLPARGALVKVLGRRGEPGVDTLSVIAQYQLPGDFPRAVLQETRKVVAGFDAKTAGADREDFTKQTIITIDPVDARDFDDAISLTPSKDGGFELGVHIADVAHFVTLGSALDIEAKERSTSVYLPGLVIPMLPELLSNGVCSLQERQPRLTKSAIITYDKHGKVRKTQLVNSVIRSTKRLTYEQASRILDGKLGRTGRKVVALVEDMKKLAELIQRRRHRQGMLEMQMPEAELVFDDEGHAIDVVASDTSYSHKIIEMFMVEANEAVARTLHKAKVSYLRRIHEEPPNLNDGRLHKLLGVLGHRIPEQAGRRDIQKLLERVREESGAFTVNLAVLRTLARAEYSPRVHGHYALASDNYSHFTSPIRRYPDLTIHRLIDAFVQGELATVKGRKKMPDENQLIELGKHCSENDRRAESAERELKLVLTLRILDKRVGDEFEGIVTGVANVGVFVQLDHFLVDGLLRFESMVDDWWEVDSTRGSVIGERTGRRITIGDRLKVIISQVNLATRQLNLSLAGQKRRSAKSKVSGKESGRGAKEKKGRARSTGQSSSHASRAPKKKKASSRSKTRRRRR